MHLTKCCLAEEGTLNMKVAVKNETDLRELITKDDPNAESVLLFLLVPAVNTGVAQVGFKPTTTTDNKKALLQVEYQGKYVTGYYQAVMTLAQYETLKADLLKLRDYTFTQTFKLTTPLATGEAPILLTDDKI